MIKENLTEYERKMAKDLHYRFILFIFANNNTKTKTIIIMKKLFYFLLMTIAITSFNACGSDDDDSGGSGVNSGASMGENNTTDLAVTGGVQTVGMTYATVKGYINFTVPEAYANLGSVYSYGVEYAKSSDFSDAKSVSGGNVTGKSFTATIKELEVNTKYYYRTYVDNNRGSEVGTFTTNEFKYDGSLDVSCSDMQFFSGIFRVSAPAASLNNETYTIGFAYSKNTNGLDYATYKRANFGKEDYDAYNKETMIAEVSGTTFVKCRKSVEPIKYVFRDLTPGSTYYCAAFIDIGGYAQFCSPISIYTRQLKGSSFNSGSYTWTKQNVGATTPFEEGTNFYLNEYSSDTGLSESDLARNFPPASVVDELNSLKKEEIRVDNILYGVVVTDRNGNELYLPLGYYITSDVETESYDLYYYTKYYYYRKVFYYSGDEEQFCVYSYGTQTIIDVSYDDRYYPGDKIMIRELR